MSEKWALRADAFFCTFAAVLSWATLTTAFQEGKFRDFFWGSVLAFLCGLHWRSFHKILDEREKADG